MKFPIIVAAACGLLLTPASAETSKSSSDFAPGQKQTSPGGAKKFAPGQKQTYPGEAKKFAPGQQAKKKTKKK
jgi:hypothetical protein